MKTLAEAGLFKGTKTQKKTWKTMFDFFLDLN